MKFSSSQLHQEPRIGSKVDPFNSTKVTVNAWSMSVLEYYIEFVTHAVFKAESTFLELPNHFRHLPALRNCVRGCLADEMHFTALTAGCLKRLKFNNAGNEHPVTPEAFAQKAYRSLRLYLERETDSTQLDPQVVLDMHMLMLFALYSSEYDAARAHVSMTIHLVERLWGFSKFSNMYQEICIAGDVGLSRATFCKPITPRTWYPPPLSNVQTFEIFARQPSLRFLGTDFSHHRAIASEDLRFIIASLVQFLVFARAHYPGASVATSATDARWLHLTAHAILHRLLSYQPLAEPTLSLQPSIYVHESPSPHSHLPHQRESLRIALIIFLSFLTTFLAPTSLGRQHPLRLKLALLQSENCRVTPQAPLFRSWEGHEDLLLWILSIGHCISSITKSEQLTWYEDRAVETVETVVGASERTFEKVQGFLERFAYWDMVQRESLVQLVDTFRRRASGNTFD
ncbi:MAG: hypothetical protein Q9227_008743 [Pyrenula ochraceoflavens]